MRARYMHSLLGHQNCNWQPKNALNVRSSRKRIESYKQYNNNKDKTAAINAIQRKPPSYDNHDRIHLTTVGIRTATTMAKPIVIQTCYWSVWSSDGSEYGASRWCSLVRSTFFIYWIQLSLSGPKNSHQVFSILALAAIKHFSFEGFVMDYYCIDRGTLLDNPSVVTLEGPDQHSVHWCVQSEQLISYFG